MQQINKNLIIGGVDIHLKKHGEKGFRVKEACGFRFNNGHITAMLGLLTLDTLVASGTAANFDGVFGNKILP